MKDLVSVITLAVLLSFTVSPIHAASFDCAKAKTFVEKEICADAELSAVDDSFDKLYREVLDAAQDKEVIKRSQREWLIKKRNSCRDKKCIKTSYEKRLTELADHPMVIGTLNLGDKSERFKIVAKKNNSGCVIKIISKNNVVIQEIKTNVVCPDDKTLIKFNPNSDEYDDFVTISSYGPGPFPNTSAWLYSRAKGMFEIDDNYPGGWPISSHCTLVKSRIGIGEEGHAYASDEYCYFEGSWR